MLLITILGALGIILSIVLNFAHQATFNEEYFFRVKNTEKAYYMAVSTLPTVLKVFQANTNSYDSLNDYWAMPILLIRTKEGKILIQIEDEERKFNPNYILKDEKIEKWHLEEFERLLSLIHAENFTANKVLDWIDKDSQITLPGGNEEAARGINCKNANMDSVEEFLYFTDKNDDFYGKTLKDKYYPGLNKLLTVYSEGKININTAGKEVLQSLDPAITERTTDIIIKRQKEKPFKDIKELLDIPGINMDILYKIEQLADVKSSYYNIKITVDLGEIKPAFNCIIKREKERIKPILWKVE